MTHNCLRGDELDTAVVFLIFNQPEVTRRVFDVIRQARPKRLFVVADGPRVDRRGETEKCAATRAIAEKVDWSSEVWRNYVDINMGCGSRVASGIIWAFQHVEEAIILEEDCLPHPTFFSFCQKLLERYRFDTRIMHIGRNNFQNGIIRGPYSYFFSKYSHIWGWATWRRAWSYFDATLVSWPFLKSSRDHRELFDMEEECLYWTGIFERMTSPHPINTWDYCWTYCFFLQGVSVYPNVNLVSNIGFKSDATHTVSEGSPLAELPVFGIEDISHPPYVYRNCHADLFTFEHVFRGPLRLNRRSLKQSIRKCVMWMLDKYCPEKGY